MSTVSASDQTQHITTTPENTQGAVGGKLLSFKILLSIVPTHAALALLHAEDSVGSSRTHASQSMTGENINDRLLFCTRTSQRLSVGGKRS